MTVCPLCDRIIDGLGLTHRDVGEGRILCGYRSRTFARDEAVQATVSQRTLARVLDALDHHLAREGVEVEVRTKDGWMSMRGLLLRKE